MLKRTSSYNISLKSKIPCYMLYMIKYTKHGGPEVILVFSSGKIGHILALMDDSEGVHSPGLMLHLIVVGRMPMEGHGSLG